MFLLHFPQGAPAHLVAEPCKMKPSRADINQLY